MSTADAPRRHLLALETSCDETAAAVLRLPDHAVLSSEISSQIDLHRPFGGVVPEVASRNHIVMVRPVVEAALAKAGLPVTAMDAFAATAGPGLASALLIGNTVAKALAAANDRPFIAVNHLEGHLLSPFLGDPAGVRPSTALVVSGGHTLLVHLRGVGDYRLLARSRDDAAGEAFDKAAKMLGLPYPGGPEIDRLATAGDPAAFAFPRSMLDRRTIEFSFSGLKTALLYTLERLDHPADRVADLCASFQEAVVEILVEQTIRAARLTGEPCVAVSGGVSGNRRLRDALADRCRRENLDLRIAAPALTTDNAAMIAFVAAHRLARGLVDPLERDVDPNLALEAC